MTLQVTSLVNGVLDQRRVVGGVASYYMDDLAYGVTAVLAGAMARLNRGASARTYKAFAIQYGDTQDASTLLGGGGVKDSLFPLLHKCRAKVEKYN